MDGPNVGIITPRANVCSCTCTRGQGCTCSCFQTNEIGVRNTTNVMMLTGGRDS